MHSWQSWKIKWKGIELFDCHLYVLSWNRQWSISSWWEFFFCTHCISFKGHFKDFNPGSHDSKNISRLKHENICTCGRNWFLLTCRVKPRNRLWKIISLLFLYRISIIVLVVLYLMSLIYKQNWKSVMENFLLFSFKFKVMQIVFKKNCCHQVVAFPWLCLIGLTPRRERGFGMNKTVENGH